MHEMMAAQYGTNESKTKKFEHVFNEAKKSIVSLTGGDVSIETLEREMFLDDFTN